MKREADGGWSRGISVRSRIADRCFSSSRLRSPPPQRGGGLGWGQFFAGLLSTLLLSLSAVAADTPKIDQAAFNKRIAANDASLLILDVRTPEEFAAGHVPGAINVPYTWLPASISSLSDAENKDIVLYCETGVRSERAAARLRENGFQRLLHLDGDMKAWREKQQPLEK
jgi:phage shock protein E